MNVEQEQKREPLPDDGSLEDLERAIGYVFADKGLLRVALTNPSYRATHPEIASVQDNQRLEFLGDAVFGLLSAQQVYERHTEEKEGLLTQLRSHLASGSALAALARRTGLGRYLLLGKGECMSGGRDKDKYLADAMEAIFGAAWLDGGWPAAQAVYVHMGVGQDNAPIKAVLQENPKGRLQEIAQHHGWKDSPKYRVISCEGPPHEPVYRVLAELATGASAEGHGGSKRAAETEAARKLLSLLGEEA